MGGVETFYIHLLGGNPTLIKIAKPGLGIKHYKGQNSG